MLKIAIVRELWHAGILERRLDFMKGCFQAIPKYHRRYVCHCQLLHNACFERGSGPFSLLPNCDIRYGIAIHYFHFPLLARGLFEATCDCWIVSILLSTVHGTWYMENVHDHHGELRKLGVRTTHLWPHTFPQTYVDNLHVARPIGPYHLR